jgi:hypothetical protein
MRIASTLGQSILLYTLINNTTFAFSGFDAYVGFIHMENAHLNPVLLTFLSILQINVKQNSGQDNDDEKGEFTNILK